jgi:energy-converting hydrogenase Eha subunit A
MLLAYLTLFAGLSISAVAEFYSIMGLIAIYPAAFWPIVIMGVVLGLGKLTGTVWLKQNWENAPVFLKTYLLPAVIFLMLITSIGVFGFLSKAHSDQSLVSGDVQAKISVYDEKIKTEKDNIDANRKSLKQMDEAVDQVMARSTSEGGADKAVTIRRSQQKERSRILSEIADSQKKITSYNEERAPIAAEVRKVEAEVGPIKYIAAFIYGDNPDANVLERAVTWVSILIVIVLDPMAVILLLASQYSFEYERKKKQQSAYEQDDGELTDEQIEQIREIAKDDLPTGKVISKQSLFTHIDDPEPEDDLEDINRKLLDAMEEAEIEEPTIDPVEDEFPFRGKGQQPSMPLMAGYLQPAVVELEPAIPAKEVVIDDEFAIIDGRMYHADAIPKHLEKYVIEHKENSVTIKDEAGVITEHVIDEPTYIQNEEQKASDIWTKITNTISEDEYIMKSKEKNKKADSE